MVSMKSRSLFLLLCACGVAALVSCPVSTPPDPDPQWTFDAGIEDWYLVPYAFPDNVNGRATLSWSNTEGSPDAGSLQIVVRFDSTTEDITVVVPFADLTTGTDLSGKKFTVQVMTSNCPAADAWIFSNTGPDFDSALSSGVNLSTAAWAPQELDLTQPPPPYDPSDMRFLGVLIQGGAGVVAGTTYTFYIDTAVISDAP